MSDEKQRIYLEARYIPEPNSGCWLWFGPVNWSDYGIVNGYGMKGMAHRSVYKCEVGPIPDDLQLDHKCNNRYCVNPEHMQITTRKENMDLSVSRRLTCRRGHPRTEANTRVEGGAIRCKVCKGLTR